MIAQKNKKKEKQNKKKPVRVLVWETSMPSKRKGEAKDALVVVASLVYIVFI